MSLCFVFRDKRSTTCQRRYVKWEEGRVTLYPRVPQKYIIRPMTVAHLTAYRKRDVTATPPGTVSASSSHLRHGTTTWYLTLLCTRLKTGLHYNNIITATWHQKSISFCHFRALLPMVVWTQPEPQLWRPLNIILSPSLVSATLETRYSFQWKKNVL